ncbi:twin-arginine translocation signal domain-containing protein [Streptomyces sp. CG1]|uniref:twin-arginine translocation signal domain-containing protein n=1 Tax=Streptomyces sp. CG1 TaxID=1287523 RepID=UPI0034E2D36B
MSSIDHSSVDRRGFLAGAAGAAAFVAGGLWALPSQAYAAGPSLPRPGQEIRCDSSARGVVLRSLAGSGTVDIDCAIRLRVEDDPGDHTGRSRRLRMLEHHMQGRSAQFGQVVITEEIDPRTLPPSTLRLADTKAPRYELRLVCPRLTVQVERLPAGVLDRIGLSLGSVLTAGRPVTLVTTEPLVLENDSLNSWELHRHSLASRQEVGLALTGLPKARVATIEPFTVLAEHSEHS